MPAVEKRQDVDQLLPANPVMAPREGIAQHSIRILASLIGVFALAIILPQPGAILRSLELPGILAETPTTLQHLLLGSLLFCAGLTVETARMPQVKIRLLSLSVLATWGTPFLVTAIICLVGKQLGVSDSVLLGLVVAAAMPVANASVGWTHLAGGNLPLILGLLLGATATAPLVAPVIMQSLAYLCLSENISTGELLPLRNLGRFLGFWVVLPAIIGLLVGLRSRSRGVVWSIPWLRRVSITCLLLLNYMNASAALPLIHHQSVVWQGLFCAFLSIGGLMLVTWQVSRRLAVPWPDCVSLSLACGMRNTGAALVLAGTQFHQEPAVAMTVLMQTLLQNVLAGILITLVTKANSPSLSIEPAVSERPQ